MTPYRSIAATLFLSIMGIMLVHNVIPHVHNHGHAHHAGLGVSDSDHHLQQQHHHHHTSNEHQEDQNPDEPGRDHESRNGLIKILLEIHAEVFHVNDLVESRHPESFDLSHFLLDSDVQTSIFSTYALAKSSELHIKYLCRCKPKLYLVNSALRAPPLLG